MGLTTEIVIFEASDPFWDNSDVVIPALDIALRAKGVHTPVYYGKRIRGTNTGYCVINWDSYEAHIAIKDAPFYGNLLKELSQSVGGARPPEIYTIQFSAPTIALDKPITEIVILTLKAPENRARVVEALSKFSESTKKMLVFGQAHSDENKYFVLCGWETIKEHEEAAAKPQVVAAVENLCSFVSRDPHYTSLSKYPLQ